MGAIGPCTSLKKANACVAETEMGEGGTYAWSLGGIDPSTTLALYFEIANASATAAPAASRRHHLQIVTKYQHSNGRFRMRVTTVGGAWQADAANLASVAASFDQEAAAVIMARYAVKKTDAEEPAEIMRWLDRALIRLCARVGGSRWHVVLTVVGVCTVYCVYPGGACVLDD